MMRYVAPECVPSVVMSRHLDARGMPMATPDVVVSHLRQHGIHRLVVGHTPQGNCPTVIKQPIVAVAPGLLQMPWRTSPPMFDVIMADTSFSDMTSADCRGCAVSEVALLPGDRVRVHGTLHDSRRVEYTLAPQLGSDGPRGSHAAGDLVGLREPSSETSQPTNAGPPQRCLLPYEPNSAVGSTRVFVKALLVEPAEYLLCKVRTCGACGACCACCACRACRAACRACCACCACYAC